MKYPFSFSGQCIEFLGYCFGVCKLLWGIRFVLQVLNWKDYFISEACSANFLWWKELKVETWHGDTNRALSQKVRIWRLIHHWEFFNRGSGMWWIFFGLHRRHSYSTWETGILILYPLCGRMRGLRGKGFHLIYIRVAFHFALSFFVCSDFSKSHGCCILIVMDSSKNFPTVWKDYGWNMSLGVFGLLGGCSGV